MNKYKIYVLIDPITDEVRYVGKTIHKLSSRLKRHLTAKDKSHRVNWIKNLKNKNMQPEIKLICETEDFDTLNELEIFYIKKYRKEGCKLVNMTNGGDGSMGFKHTDESIEKMKKAAKKRVKMPEVIEKLKANGLKQWNNKTEQEKKDNQINQPNRKYIYQYDMNDKFIKKHNSLRGIERELGFFRANITPCLKGEFKQAYGFIWKYN